MTKENPDNLYDQQFDDAAGDAAAADYGDAYYDDAYDGAYDNEVGGEDAAAGAAGAGAGAAAAATGGGGGGAHAKKGGLPLRGLAMVLIAVAVMLGLWGLYAMTSEDDDSTVASDSEQSKSDGSANGGQEGNGAGGPAADGARGDGSRDGANNQPPREGEGDNAHPNAEGEANRDAGARGGGNDRGGDEARAGGNDTPSAARDRNDIKVSVLNNSGESDKAKNEADVLKDGGFKVGYVGNLPGDVLTVPKTTVFYPEGDTSAESLAKEVAARYQAEIKPMNKDLPKEATEDGAVVVALAVPQA